MNRTPSGFTSFYADAFKRLRRDRVAVTCAFFILFLIFIALFASLIAPYDVAYQDVDAILSGPSKQHLLGTDEFGRDILTRMIYGSRVSLSVGLVADTIAMLIGVTVGSIAAYYGGKVDMILSRITEVFAAFPQMLFAIVIMFALGRGILNVFLAIGLVGWTGIARVIRSQVLQLKDELFIDAARAAGGKNLIIIMKHMIPNCLSTIIVILTMEIPSSIMYEASLSFLGLGVQPPQASWGEMISSSRAYLKSAPGYSIFPGLALLFTVLAFNMFGEALRDALDPRLKNL